MKLGKKSRLNSIVCALVLAIGLICTSLLPSVTNIVYAGKDFENPIKNYQFAQSSNSEFIATLNNWTKVTYDSYNADNYNSGAVKWKSIETSENESDKELWDDFKLVEGPGEVIKDSNDSIYDTYLMINAFEEAGRLGYKTSSSFALEANSYYSIEVTYKTIKATNEQGTSDSYASIYLKNLSNNDFDDESKFENLTTFNATTNTNVWATRTFYIATSPYSSENLNLELWLGGENESQICKGSVFFSHVDVQRYTESAFNEATKDVTSNNTKSLIDLDNDYVELDLIDNANFEEGIIYSVPNWTPIHTSMSENDVIQTINYSSFANNKVSNPKSNEAENNEKGLFMYLENVGNLSMQSSKFTLSKRGYYLLSVWANSNSGISNSAQIQLVNLDKDGEYVSNAGDSVKISTTISPEDANNYRNGWIKYSIYIHTDNFTDSNFALRLNLTEGYAFFDEIEIKQISSSNYTTGSQGSNSISVDLNKNTSSGLVANSNFNSVTYEGNSASFPAKPVDWTLNTQEEYEGYVAGVITTNSLDFEANKSNYPGLANPGNYNNLDSNFVLAMGCNNVENELTFKSNAFELSAKTDYLLTFQAKTQIKELGNNAKISLKVYNDSLTVYEFKDIQNLDWEEYSLLISTGYSAGNYYIDLTINNVDGYVFFDEINLDTAPESYFVGNNHNVVELNSALVDSINNWSITSGNSQYVANTTSTEVGKYDEILNFYGIENPSYIDSNNKEVLYIHNENDDYVTLTSKNSYSFTANNYYVVSIYVQTSDILESGARFAITYNETTEEFTDIISNSSYTKYSFYISTEKDVTAKISIGLGTEDALAMGTVFFDVLSVKDFGTDETSFNTEYEETSSHSDNVKMVAITVPEETPEEDSETDPEDPATETDPATVWMAVSSSITALALVIALVGFALRKINWKKHSTKKVATTYDRRSTLDKNMDKRQRIELRKVLIDDLKKEFQEEGNKFNEYKLNIDKQIEELNEQVVSEITPIKEELQALEKEQDSIEQEHNAKIAVDKRSTTPEEDKAFNAKVKNLEKREHALQIKIDKIEADAERKISKLQFNLDLKKMRQDEINDQINSLKDEIAEISNE